MRSETFISSDEDFIRAALWSLPGGEWESGGKNIPEQELHDALRRVYGIEDVYYPDVYGWSDGLSNVSGYPPGYAAEGYKDGMYRYWYADGMGYENHVTINSLWDNGDGTFTVLAKVRYGPLEIDDNYEDFRVVYPELRVVLKPIEDSFQFVSLGGNPMPDALFIDSAQPPILPMDVLGDENEGNPYAAQLEEFRRQIIAGEWFWIGWDVMVLIRQRYTIMLFMILMEMVLWN